MRVSVENSERRIQNHVGYHAKKPNGDFDEWYTMERDDRKKLLQKIFSLGS